MKTRGHIVVAQGNYQKGYAGLAVKEDETGRERVVLEPCDHRHSTTSAARTCAALRLR